ncbi:MAG: tyrosyl-tRNA synthetase [Verrucomicrobiales bacterium]|jgi:tyrosyl-tRNA synthetase
MPTPKETLALLTSGTAKVINEKDLLAKLEEDRPLRIKLGVDPTAPDIHLGHTVPLEKLRQFQELDHQIVLIIGDFTAMIGDPSGRSTTRPDLGHEEVMANAKTYTDQAFKIIDQDKTEVVYNGDWFSKMTFTEVMKLNSRVTMQQMLQREDFKNRIEKAEEVRLHEIQYPIMQGWDSVEVRSDVEIGGTDQLFNILVGRDMQKAMGMPQQVAMLMPILEGLDGTRKMSKSYGNYIGVNDSPDDMFGKAMSISDELMVRYYELLLGETLDAEMHPMEAKKQLATRLVNRYHDDEAGLKARSNWEDKAKNSQDADYPNFDPSTQEGGVLTVASAALQECFAVKRSGTEIRQLLKSGAIQVNGEKISDPKAVLELADGDVFRLGKKHSVRIKRP